jgi:hypothetical protein
MNASSAIRLCIRVRDLRQRDVIALTKVNFPHAVVSVQATEGFALVTMEHGWPSPTFSDDPRSAINLIGGPRFAALHAHSLPCWECAELYVPDPGDPFPRFCARCAFAEALATAVTP